MIVREIVMIPLRLSVIGLQTSMWFLNEDIRTLEPCVHATVNGMFLMRHRNSVLAIQSVGGVRTVVMTSPPIPPGLGFSSFTAPYQGYGQAGVGREFSCEFVPDDLTTPYNLAVTAISRDAG